MGGSSSDESARRTFPVPNQESVSGLPFDGENLWDETSNSNNEYASNSNNEYARKRTYSTHIDHGSPSMPESKAPRFGELFGDVNEHEQRELAFRQRREQEEQDAALARMMQEQEEEEAQESFSHNEFESPSGPSSHDRSRQYQPADSPEPRMPGSWNIGEDNFVDLTDDQPNDGFVPSSSTINMHARDLAHHAAIQRQRLETNAPFPGPSENSTSSRQRPGFVTDGTTSPLANGAYANGAKTSSVYRPGTSSLADIVQRTNNYDYASSTNEYGDPLDNRVFIPFGDDDESDQVKALLTNISTEAGTADGDSTPAALKEPLYKHQQIALKWMKGMEADEHKRGGILADDMGLGKTISSLALIVRDRTPEHKIYPGRGGTNIVVAPVSLIAQWEKEIESKLKYPYSLAVWNYHKKKLPFSQLRKYDVVLTSYGKLGQEYKALDYFTKDKTDKGEPLDKDVLAEKFPFLCAKQKFLRVIVDEAQMIKNKSTQMHQAVCRIPAEYRWCLSGTPMMNSVDEMGSLIHFLRIKPYNDPQEFRRKFNALYPKGNKGFDDPASVMKSLQVLLRAIMLRRTKTSMIDGEPIITLPPKTEITDHVIFNEDEQQYYDDLEHASRVEFSKYLRAGTVGKHYQYVLVKLLRLRQACCHPYLHITDLEFTNNANSETDMTTLAKEIHSTRVDALMDEDTPFLCPICYEYTWNPSILVPCGHYACHECLQLHANSSEQQRIEGGKPRCIICRAEFDMKKAITYSAFKDTFMPETGDAEAGSPKDAGAEAEAADSDEDDSDSETDSGEDEGDDIDDRGNLKDFIVDDDDDEYKPKPRKGKGKSKAKSKAKGKKKKAKKEEDIQPHMLAKLRKEASRNVDAHRKYLSYLTNIWLPSAKIDKCRQLIQDIQETGEKTIVFSQWTLLLDLMEVPLKEDGLRFRRYDGGMSAKQRDEAVQEFAENPRMKVMLTSLKAGNAGLNLVCASRVIIMDPFWNPFIEKQAVDRTYRIGQRKPVTVHRILVKETVEDRIMELQEEKRNIVEGAMDEKVAKDLGRLSSNDLAFLFGVGPRH
ncbi:SNF2 family N-terminal domain-containing protein [Apiospora marii]|uniref:SNF2 family N-terminal domain-containing protein n=1 Tax=Apiospora marii TaxID=335849 RepID=A0ABR1REV2_9PEZI